MEGFSRNTPNPFNPQPRKPKDKRDTFCWESSCPMHGSCSGPEIFLTRLLQDVTVPAAAASAVGTGCAACIEEDENQTPSRQYNHSSSSPFPPAKHPGAGTLLEHREHQKEHKVKGMLYRRINLALANPFLTRIQTLGQACRTRLPTSPCYYCS